MGKLKLVNGKVEDYTIVLATKELSHLGQLTGVTNITSVENLNASNEFSFTVHKNDLNSNYASDIKEYRDYIWRNLNDLRLIWVKELDEYFQIQTPLNDSRESVTKNIVCKSLCEAELSQTTLNTIEINTEADILRKDYVATTFYNAENKKASLLHRVLEKAPAYTIGHVDESLKDVQRTFSIDGTTIYDFLVGECAKQVNCLFIFDSAKRTVSAYDLYESYCNECGKRGDFDTCTDCGSSNLSHYGYGEDTTILVDKNNLTDSISFETNVDSIKNCFKLEAGDEIMTAVVRSLLQTGSDYLTYFPDWQREQMPQELQDKLKEYDDKYADYKSDYQDFLGKLYAKMDEKTYLEYTKFPEIEKFEITARTEADKITNESMTDVALTSLNENTLSSSVNNAVKNYAKVMIMTGYVKIEIDPDTEAIFTYEGESDGYHYGTWTGKFKITNYSDSEDVAYTGLLTIRISDNYEDFVKQRALKEIKGSDSDDGSVYNVLAIDDLDKFKEAIKEYNLSSLQSFYDAIDGALCVLQQEELTDTEIYKSYYDKLCACEEQKNCIGEQITILEKEIEDYSSKIEKIQSELNIETHLGDLYPIFCTYKREDKYSNSNYISDGLDNSQLLESANEFIEVATQELYNSCEKQHSISSSLFNLLAIKEFEPIVKYFKVGNWIRIKVDGALYKLRLISYTINYDDLNTINVTFSNVTKVFNPKVQRDSLMSSVQSMATSYGTVSRQAESGKDASDELDSLYNEGLNGELIQIKNNDKEEVTYGKHGLLCRTYDDITESYSPQQLRVTHNIIAFTNDNWATVSLGLGNHKYKYYDTKLRDFKEEVDYGMSAKFVNAGYVYGSQIVGGEIYSTNYSKDNKIGSVIDLENGLFNFGNRLILDNDSLTLNNGTINGGYLFIGSKDENSTYAEITETGLLNCNSVNIMGGKLHIGNNFSVDENGNLVATSAALDKLSVTTSFKSVSENGSVVTIDDGVLITNKEGGRVSTSFSIDDKEAPGSVSLFSDHIRFYPESSFKGDCGEIRYDPMGGGYVFEFTKSILFNESGYGIWGTDTNGTTYRMLRNDEDIVKIGNTSQPLKLFSNSVTSGTSLTQSISDKRLKKEYESLDKYESFFMSLTPVSYKYIIGNSGRTHIGIIAQDVEKALLDNNLTTMDFAGFCETKIDSEIKERYKECVGEDISCDTIYEIRYNEFTMLNTHMIQKLFKRIEKLENKLN